MQILLTASDMAACDRRAIERYKIPGVLLMENAGRAFVDALVARVKSLRGLSVAVVCGKGNNGGDGFAIARLLVNHGCSIDVIMLAPTSQVAGDAKTNLNAVSALAREKTAGIRLHRIRRRKDFATIGAPDVIIDAIFGTGFRGSPRGILADAIAWINEKDTIVGAVDIPSGVDASTGRVEGAAVEADLTVTFGAAKIGHFCGEGRDHCGDVVVADIGIPHFLLTPTRTSVFRVGDDDVRGVLPQRPSTLHKYSAGKVLVIAGSRNFTGAPCLTSEAVLRSGAGASLLAIPESIHPIVARKLTEVVLLPLGETATGSLAGSAMHALVERFAWADCVAIGPGMSRNPETIQLVRDILATCGKPVILDADAISACEGHETILRIRKAATIMTPHAGEMSQLIGEEPKAIELRRIDAAREFALAAGVILVLKGAPTVTATPDGDIMLNSTGNPGMATVGSGDVLTGLIAGLCAQGIAPELAAMAGVWIHGRAGDRAAARLGQRSVMAGDIMEEIPAVFTVLGERG